MHHAFAFDEGGDLAEELGDDPRFPLLQRALKNGRLTPEMQKKIGQRQMGITSFFASYVPGLETMPFPAGTGKLLNKNPTLNFTLHYTTNGMAGTDLPQLGLYFSKNEIPKRKFKINSAFNFVFNIPAETSRYPVSAEKIFNKPIELFGLSPHMHYRGRSMKYTAIFPDGRQELLLSVPHYDLDWQRAYVFAEPKILPAGTIIRVNGVFDNSAMNEDNPDPQKSVRFGLQSTDEMFIGYMIYAETLSE
jgi:hypothetical protein